jgi:hypothetical protein
MENTMFEHPLIKSSTLALATAFVVLGAAPGYALTAKECSVKYKAAKSGGTLNGLNWNEFRKQQCEGTAPVTEAKTKTPPPSAAVNAVFPSAVDKKYAKQSAGKARFHTCLDQYHANKANGGNGGNGGLKWIAKGGGYYSECNKALKG